MRERAAAVGGWLTAGRRGGRGFRVLAELPAPAPAPAPDSDSPPALASPSTSASAPAGAAP